MAFSRTIILVLLAAQPALLLAAEREAVFSMANPIRKVVKMLQHMQQKVSAEGEREKELYDKFMCYCKTGGGDLQASIAAASTKAPQVASDIEESEAKLVQTKSALKQAQTDRAAAKSDLAEATAIRKKEEKAYAAEKAEFDTNIAAIKKAVAALEKGMAGSFLQTGAAQLLKKILMKRSIVADMLDGDRQDVLAFLSGTQKSGYAPASGEITGILKQMGDTMSNGLAESTEVEMSAIGSFEGLVSAKTKEIAALTKSIEAKTTKVGELGLSIVEMKDDLFDTEAALKDDTKFLADMERNCATKTAEYEEHNKNRALELVALADTIKILNDDDALELFKKTLPAPGSFIQVEVKAREMRSRAISFIQKARETNKPGRAGLDFLMLALRGQKVGFSKVLKMIDEMVANLKREQINDETKKAYCEKQLDTSDDKRKALDRTVKDEEAAIEDTKEAIATLKEEIAALAAGITALDKSVAEATEQRKEENADWKELMASDSAAKEILGFARNRLNKFYAPKLYQPPAKVELSREDKLVSNLGGEVLAQVSSHTQRSDSDSDSDSDVAPPPPPEVAAAYTKKSEESTGVIALIDMLVKDIVKEMTEGETQEKESQKDYEAMMQDSAEKRAQDAKSLTDKEAAKANSEARLEAHKTDRKGAMHELLATVEFISSLHAECDWLLQYSDVRKEARTGEIESLTKAKAVLNGADYSFLQVDATDLLKDGDFLSEKQVTFLRR